MAKITEIAPNIYRYTPNAEVCNSITEMFESGKLVTNVGTVLPLEEARVAHEMLGGAPHKRGKIVLTIAA